MIFTTEYKNILEQIENIDAVKYAKTRNYIDGNVTYLSPYISRGVISLTQIKNSILQKYKPYQAEKLLQELAWREYWQRIWENIGDKLFTDIKQPQPNVVSYKMIAAIENGTTEITAIDKSIEELYATGYMHNHCRIYVASIACNIANAHWLQPSQWMYYHLLDGDLASNSLSWQWVASTFSSKKYYCNQDNINKYTSSNQRNTFLDCTYEELPTTDTPKVLQQQTDLVVETELPNYTTINIDSSLPVLLYNSYNLDPTWHIDDNANRILLLEPSHFKKFPVSKKVIEFIIALSKNIEDVQIFVGEFYELQQQVNESKIHFKKHPAFLHYKGIAENYDYMFPQVSGYYNSFFSYWKKCEKHL
jgi:deoxyribodipyrimidine photo-lyase